MKAICPREDLLSACQLASAAIPAKEVKPILRNLKAIASDGRCTLMATDLEVGIRLDVQPDHSGTGRGHPAGRQAHRHPARDAGTRSCSSRPTPAPAWSRGNRWTSRCPARTRPSFPSGRPSPRTSTTRSRPAALREMIRRTLFAVADDGPLFDDRRAVGAGRRQGPAGRHRRPPAGRGPGHGHRHGGHTTKGQAPVVPTKAMSLLERNLQDDTRRRSRCASGPTTCCSAPSGR